MSQRLGLTSPRCLSGSLASGEGATRAIPMPASGARAAFSTTSIAIPIIIIMRTGLRQSPNPDALCIRVDICVSSEIGPAPRPSSSTDSRTDRDT